MEGAITIMERDESGRLYKTVLSAEKEVRCEAGTSRPLQQYGRRTHIVDFLVKVFLPAGYPKTVSPDYMRYQILNALQAFCNSLSSLLSSRALLEGFGVGDPSASATNALLLTILQDVFSRITTIVAAYFIGSSLYPEAKTYRLLADIFNDVAIILDILSPALNTPYFPGLRIIALCFSATLRALCGVAAGGSKAAITMHFATPLEGTGDVGDLNAKDASKETVLALLGMLLGSLIVPHLTTAWSIYSMLFTLIGLHVAINYVGVRGLVFRSLNRQRTSISWSAYRSAGNIDPSTVAQKERIFDLPGTIRDFKSQQIIGHCQIGSALSSTMGTSTPSSILRLFDQERYVLWFDHQCLPYNSKNLPPQTPIRLHVCLKDGYSNDDLLKAWTHAVELCHLINLREQGINALSSGKEASGEVQKAYKQTMKLLPSYLEHMRSVSWNTNDVGLMIGAPKAVLMEIGDGEHLDDMSKKSQ